MYTPTDWRRVWRLPGEADSGLGVWTLFWVGKRELLFLRPWGAQGPASPRLPHLGAGTRAWDRALALIVGVCPGAGPPSAPSRAPAERNLSPLCCCEGPMTGLRCRMKPVAADPAEQNQAVTQGLIRSS